MSVSRSARCLFCTFKQASKAPVPRRTFHLSAARRQGKKEDDVARPKPITKESITPYTEEERNILREKFTDAQIAALEAGESAISAEDLANQAARRPDAWKVNYFDDFSKVDPVVDKPIRPSYSNFDPDARLKEEEDFERDLASLIERLPADATFETYKEMEKKIRMTTGDEAAETNSPSALAPELFEKDEMFDRNGDVITRPKKSGKIQSNDGGVSREEVTPALLRLMQMTGYTQRQISQFRVKTIISHAVVNQTRLGKIRKQYFLTIAGNGNGLIGIGEGKSIESEEARLQSQYRAIRDMRPILRYEKRTIFGDVKGKSGATELELYNRPPGIQDLAAKVTRARNPMNTVKAAVQALMKQKDPEEVARARGRKMVDVRKVYYAGGLSN
ncbi:putative 37s ribosomal protein s5 [Phaeomoniella chlamydospora]|uniref:Small ribosomal subunit protein uS5m n=1 Tax=Phaeomoniella chlamydospora TaxID=158046 RepID=A0A0G2E4M4_PHACM|nr:putative 37s ribosomal protein s5 [Phaeomoniella chlamydospora]